MAPCQGGTISILPLRLDKAAEPSEWPGYRIDPELKCRAVLAYALIYALARAPVLLSRICAQGHSAALRECSRSRTVIVRGLDRNAPRAAH